MHISHEKPKYAKNIRKLHLEDTNGQNKDTNYTKKTK